MFGSGTSALTDDDLLSSELNSLHINLEAHAAEQRERDQHQQQQQQQQQLGGSSAAASALRNVASGVGGMGVGGGPGAGAPPGPPQGLPRQTRAPSFSAGDPFSSSAQASRYFAQVQQLSAAQQQQQQVQQPPRFPFTGGVPLAPFAGAGGQNLPPQQQMARAAPGQLSIAPVSTPSFFSGAPISAGPGGGFAVMPVQAMGSFAAGGGPFSPNFAGAGGVMGGGNAELSELGKGVPLHQVPMECPLFIVEFKAGRTDLFYVPDPGMAAVIGKGDLVIVEADRGKDLGKVLHDQISIEEVQAFQQHQVEVALGQLAAAPTGGQQAPPNPAAIARMTKEIHPKKIYAKATQNDAQLLIMKAQDEAKALALCRSKAMQRGLQMEITAAEWQHDRRKLTFYYIADKRVDFRELVRELFRIWKTRIWMCSVNP